MVGGLLYLFHLLSFRITEGEVNLTQLVGQLGTLRQKTFNRQLGQAAQGNKILYFHTHAVAYQSLLGEIGRQGLNLVTIAAVYR